MDNKYQWIIDNYTNGNRTDASNAVKKLSKVQLMELVLIWGEYMNFGERKTLPCHVVEDIKGLLER